MNNGIADILKELSDKFNLSNVPIKDVETIHKLKLKSLNDLVGNLNEIDGFNCDICKNKGHYYIWDDGETQVDCRCKKIRATLRKAQKSGLGDILSEMTFDKFKDIEPWQKNLKNSAMNFCKDDNAKWFYIGGQSGCGKSHLCTAIAAHYIKALKDVKYMLWMEDSKKLKSMVNDIAYQDEINQYKNAEVLYIDDFLKMDNGEKPTSGDMKLAFEIINNRLLSKDKITIISSERIIDELIDYDEATMSRIFQKAGEYRLSIPKDRKKNYRLRT